MTKISLSHDTVSAEDIDALITWLRTNPRLTQGEKVKEFEQAFARKVGSRYAVFVNSGSSANLIMVYALKIMGRLPNNRVALPAISWATDLAPLIQFGIEPVLLDVGPGLVQTGETLKPIKNNVDALLLVSILGSVENYEYIEHTCKNAGVTLIEDACESLMSAYKDGRKVGTVGLMGTYSFYFSHHISTIEGGMVVTDDEECYTVLKMLRSHGWGRDIDPKRAGMLKTMFNISDFNEQFTFYLPGFNVRGTDLQATIGMEQLKKLDNLSVLRQTNYRLYQKYMPKHVQFESPENGFICNFGFPIKTNNRQKLAEAFKNANIECRPLISGSMNRQPMWKHYVGKNAHVPFADLLTDTGMYLPNHHGLTEEDIKKVCLVVKATV